MLKKTRELFKERLFQFRKAKFPRQEDFAPILGMSTRGYQKYEQGTSWPKPEVLDVICEKLGCKPWELMRDSKDATSNNASMAKVISDQQLEIEELKTELDTLRIASKQIAARKASADKEEAAKVLARKIKNAPELNRTLSEFVVEVDPVKRRQLFLRLQLLNKPISDALVRLKLV